MNPSDSGYFCVSDESGPLVQGEARPGQPPEIHVMGDAPIVIDKMFGPLVFQSIRVVADISSGDWIVERETRDGWEEVARFEGQTAAYFDDHESE